MLYFFLDFDGFHFDKKNVYKSCNHEKNLRPKWFTIFFFSASLSKFKIRWKITDHIYIWIQFEIDHIFNRAINCCPALIVWISFPLFFNMWLYQLIPTIKCSPLRWIYFDLLDSVWEVSFMSLVCCAAAAILSSSSVRLKPPMCKHVKIVGSKTL